MPLTRYQIRNEFNLADPDLYRTADKDDPEALLEGVAMAGLVGVLRQLGDLAEFAAEIFHDLHEEVMATAARGHGLMARIQQLEADVPLIEKNLLSQTNHTAFYYNTGVDWHTQMCTDQNLITQGDMPRFIRDSYEECRGPPQLFLLDKFDIGGAGACLKRYTDPSSFKAEPTTSDAAKLGVQRHRRTRKIKKKGSRWRNGDTPEVLTISHAKLHQLLLEERIGNDGKDYTRHVKLKKRILDGSKSNKSYMEKFLQTMSPEHSETHEVEVGQPILRLTYNHTDASEREILDIQPVIAAEDSHYFSHTGQEMKLRPSVMYSYDFSKSRRKKGSTVSVEDGTAPPLHISVTEKELGVDGYNRNGNGIISPYYDAIANETENYMDALPNMESEAETDNEYIPKKESRNFSKHTGVNDSKEQVLDSQSVDNSVISDDGSISFMKGTSISSSHGASPHEEHGDIEAGSSLSMRTYEAVIVDYPGSSDYNETEKTKSDRYLNANGETIGSIAIPYNYNVGDTSLKDSSHLLQSFESGLSSTQFTSAGEYYDVAPSEVISDLEFSQHERNGVNGGAVTTPDGPCEVDKVSVIRASIERHESKVPSKVLALGSKDFSHDHSKLSSMIENKTLQKRHVDEFLTVNSVNEEVASSQSATDTQLQDFEQGYQDRNSRSHLIQPTNDNINSDHASASKDDNDGFNHVMDSTEENVKNNDAALREAYAYDDGGLYTTKTELAATELLSETCDTEGHVNSDKLSFQTVLKDDVALESGSSGKYDYGQAVSPECIRSVCGNRNSDEEVICQSDSITQNIGDLQTEGEVTLEGVPPLPPLPPMQWMAEKPQDSFIDADGGSAEFIMASNGSLPPFAFGLKGSFHSTPLDEGIKQPRKDSQRDECLQNISSHYPGGFPLPFDSTPQFKDATEVHGPHSLLTSDKFLTDSSIHPWTYLESGQPDTLAFARETPPPSSGSCLPTSSTYTDAFTIEAVQSSYTAQFAVPLSGDMSTHTKEIIQPRPAEQTIFSAGKTMQSSATWESPQPPLGDTIVSEEIASEVPALSTDQSLEESNSYSRTEHETQSDEGKIIKHPEVPSPLIKDEEHRKQEIKSLERQASWSLALHNYEGEKVAEKPAVRPPRPRNPLIESVDALDRSKLKKVIPQNRPKTPTGDERGSLLEQIRAKSFNLKPAPAPVAKPIIQVPTMNLKVAAILEKANKIRRATAGSDEDDEDEWSDD